jgi:nucleotide-binding universal stress UspA family protein
MRTILVGLDASDRAGEVLAAAIRLARLTGAKLHVFRGVGVPREVPVIAWAVSPSDLEQILERDARDSLQALVKDVPTEVLAGVSVAIGTPWQAICDEAKKLDADAILIGSHGYGGLDRLIGTTAAKVVNHADRSVIVVRDPKRL